MSRPSHVTQITAICPHGEQIRFVCWYIPIYGLSQATSSAHRLPCQVQVCMVCLSPHHHIRHVHTTSAKLLSAFDIKNWFDQCITSQPPQACTLRVSTSQSHVVQHKRLKTSNMTSGSWILFVTGPALRPPDGAPALQLVHRSSHALRHRAKLPRVRPCSRSSVAACLAASQHLSMQALCVAWRV